MAKRHRRDPERETFWRKALARQQESGLNVRRWCSREDLPETAFYFWRRTIAQRDRDANRASLPVRQRSPQAVRQRSPQAVRQRSPQAVRRCLPKPMFVPVTLAMPREHPIVIRLRGGRVMRLPLGMEARRVAELVHAIEDASAPLLPAVSLSAAPSQSKVSNESKGVAS